MELELTVVMLDGGSNAVFVVSKNKLLFMNEVSVASKISRGKLRVIS